MPTIPDLYKECGKCKQVLGFVEFGLNAKTPSGLKSYCRACHNADGKQCYAKNKAKVDAKNTQWAKSNREKVAVVAKRWRDNNPEKASAAKRLWRELNPDKVIAQKQAWNKANAELYADASRLLPPSDDKPSVNTSPR